MDRRPPARPVPRRGVLTGRGQDRVGHRRAEDRLGFRAEVTPLQSIADMLDRVRQDGYADFTHPRFYNIDWMTLLAEVQPYLAPFESVT